MTNVKIQELPLVIPSNDDLVLLSQQGKTRNSKIEDVRDKSLRTEIENARGAAANLKAKIDSMYNSINNLWTGTITLSTSNQSFTLLDSVTNYNKLRVTFGGTGNFIDLDVYPWLNGRLIEAGASDKIYHVYAGSIDITLDFTTNATTALIKATSSIAIRSIYGIKEGTIW